MTLTLIVELLRNHMLPQKNIVDVKNLTFYKYMKFSDLDIIEPILKAVHQAGYTSPSPIQEQSIPVLLQKKDLLGCAQTGTGKTAAFSIPIIQHLFLNKKHNNPRQIKALVISPTRELAIQINDSFETYGKYTSIKSTVVFGGVKQNAQVNAVKRGVDVLVATPGRLLDLINQGFISIKHIEYFVLDEADHLLDMGFIHDIRKIVELLPHKRQSLFFSATMPQEIVNLSHKILGNPHKITIKPQQATAERVGQSVYYVSKKSKAKLLTHILQSESFDSTIVFSRTKHGADKIARILKKGNINAEAIHGNKSQNARQRTLSSFKGGETKVLVATDIAARGIDVSQLALVVNYDLPNISETYVHRIGRTGRAAASGVAISFCSGEEKPYLKDIQKLIKQQIPVIDNHPFPDDGTEDEPVKVKKPDRRKTAGSGKPKTWKKNPNYKRAKKPQAKKQE